MYYLMENTEPSATFRFWSIGIHESYVAHANKLAVEVPLRQSRRNLNWRDQFVIQSVKFVFELHQDRYGIEPQKMVHPETLPKPTSYLVGGRDVAASNQSTNP